MNTTSTSGFEFLPANPTYDNIEIYSPFAKLADEHFLNRGLNIRYLENESILISFDKMDLNTKKQLLKEIKYFLKQSRQKIINNFLIYKGNKMNYL